ncbi:MAG: C1 family peptidase [Victivallales bacterium]|nr:C1 family peptidase [Victivallales bacterium]
MFHPVLNLRRDHYDRRDRRLSTPLRPAVALPSAVDHRAELPPVWQQGEVGSCFAHAGCAAMSQVIHRESGAIVTPSRLCLATTTRFREGTLSSDSGATLRGTIKTMVKIGVPPESLYPYDIAGYYTLPPQSVLDAAEKWQTLGYYRIAADHAAPARIRQALAAGFMVMIGVAIYESLLSDAVVRTGIVSLPRSGEEMMGGHAMAVVGYDHDRMIVRNSWGAEWGDKGHCLMPEAYFAGDMLWDAWVISRSESGQ